jgi:hypothetical protein
LQQKLGKLKGATPHDSPGKTNMPKDLKIQDINDINKKFNEKNIKEGN